MDLKDQFIIIFPKTLLEEDIFIVVRKIETWIQNFIRYEVIMNHDIEFIYVFILVCIRSGLYLYIHILF